VLEHLRWDAFIAVAVAGLAFVLQGDSGEEAAWNTLLLTVAGLVVLAALALVYHVIRAPVLLLRGKDRDLVALEADKDRELDAARAEIRELKRAKSASPQLSFGRPELPGTWQDITLPGTPLRYRGRVIRVPVINALGAGQAKQVHARLRFTDVSGRFDRMFMPAETQGRWSGEEEPGEVIDLPGNGRRRMLDVVVILDGQYPHAHEWTTQSWYADLRGYAIKANPFRVEIDVMGAGDGGDAPRINDTLEIDLSPKHMIKADWLGPSRVRDQGDTWVAWG
jgi:hypothetical protein